MHIQRRTKDLFTNEQLSRLSRISSVISKLKTEKKKIFLIYTKEDQAIFEMGAVQPFLP